jgi:SRSO17 transposase
MTFPLIFEVSKPRERLQPGYKYLTQSEIAGGIRIRELRLRGFRFNLILADSLYGESG